MERTRLTHAALLEGPLGQTCVALDLETTGLDAQRDNIIEFGAVKFRGPEVIDTFECLVNPYQPLPPFVQRLTGITQRELDASPPFNAIADQISEFVGAAPIIGHNVSFDTGFLARQGITFSGQSYDTWDLAAAILPSCTEYSLPRLCRFLNVKHRRPHRALADAEATHAVLMALMEHVLGLDPSVAASIQRLAAQGRWSTGALFATSAGGNGAGPTSTAGLQGVDTAALSERLPHRTRLRASQDSAQLNEDRLVALLGPDGPFASVIPGFEHRPQQVEMLQAVARAFNEESHLLAEAGTGVGKSLAYLLPALLFAYRTGRRVVVSTNTINLQEQLLQKDLPALIGMLEQTGLVPENEVRVAALKGRSNYLCVRRHGHLSRSDNLTPDEARLLSKSLVWLQDTATGDRAELNLAGRDGTLWHHISAGDRGDCPGIGSRDGPCFLRAAREAADSAHVVVVNHSLLLSDLAHGGNVLPEYQHLIVDEAHHLEEEATRQLGFEVPEETLQLLFDTLGRLITDCRVLLRTSAMPPEQGRSGDQRVGLLEAGVPHCRETWRNFWNLAETFLRQHSSGGDDRAQLSLDRSARTQPLWSELEIAWENVDGTLGSVVGLAEGVLTFLDQTSPGDAPDSDTGKMHEAAKMHLESWQQELDELRSRLGILMSAPLGERIDWLNRQPGDDGRLRLNSAPLNPSTRLREELFLQKKCVILTSATLSTQGNFDYIRDRVGVPDCPELMVGSPFDYKKAALLLLPEAMPDPNDWGYQDALSQVLVGLGEQLDGHMLALFTSHASLRGVARAVRPGLEAMGIRVLAQGVDGSARRLLQEFSEDSRCVLLGTASFWEGVDIGGGLLRAVVLTRLPFHVPTEPIFAARAELFDDSFGQYALPQAVLRFRQGIGRLIRGSDDRGAIVVLDRRITGRAYGKAFLQSMPPCTELRAPLSAIPTEAARWVARGST